MGARARVAAAAGAALSALSKAAGRGSGGVIGGHAILAIDPRALADFAAGRRVALVSGTNGKTTTTRLLAQALEAATGSAVVTNLTGANLPSGLAATLARGEPGASAVLEVDEAWLGKVSAEVSPAVVVLLNLSRDQLDRNNEVRQVAQRWRRACGALPPGSVVVANADDPLVAWAASAAARVTWVGAGLSWRNDAAGCPQCAGAVSFCPLGDEPGSGQDWKCGTCGLARPHPDLWLDSSSPGGRAVLASGESYELHLRLPGRCNQANAVSVIGAVLNFGYAPEDVLPAMAGVLEVAGRYASVPTGSGSARLLLAKNPAGWAEIFQMLAPAPAPVVVAVNARTADGHDPSWLWDVPFERLGGRLVVATGERCLDLAVRLHYAGVGHSTERDLARAVQVAAAPGADFDVVANYTAFHELLARLPRAPAAAGGPSR